MAGPGATHLLARRFDSQDLGGVNGAELRQAGAAASRNIVLALDSSDTAERLLQWAIHNLYRKGDVFHLVHVALVLAHPEEVHHQVPGMSVTFQEGSLDQAKAHAEQAKVFVRQKFVAPLQAAHISYQPHLFVDKDNTPPESISAAVDGVAHEVQATMVVVARSNKTAVQKFFVGSVAAKISELHWPLVLVP